MKIQRVGNLNDPQSMSISGNNPYTIIFQNDEMMTQAIGIGVICGLIIFLLLTWILYEFGFFKRKLKDELIRQRAEFLEWKRTLDEHIYSEIET